jgi:hypothetical protein
MPRSWALARFGDLPAAPPAPAPRQPHPNGGDDLAGGQNALAGQGVASQRIAAGDQLAILQRQLDCLRDTASPQDLGQARRSGAAAAGGAQQHQLDLQVFGQSGQGMSESFIGRLDRSLT